MAGPHRILIPGAEGFLGTRLVKSLSEKGHLVTGLSRSDLDLCDRDQVEHTVSVTKPEVIINAAGISTPRTCSEDPPACFAANTTATFNLLEAIRSRAPGCHLTLLSSAAIYGPGAGEPLTEDDPPAPHSIYGASKLAAEILVGQRVRSKEVSATILRIFNLIGPGQPAGQAAGEFADAVREAIGRGENEVEITVGDPRIARDFTDVRDAAEAIALTISLPGVFNLCSGRQTTLLELADALADLAREQTGPGFAFHLEAEQGRINPGDPLELCGRPDRLRAATGWRPRTPLKTSLGDLLTAGPVSSN